MTPVDVVDRFNAAFDARDVDAVMALTTPDCVFEGTPAPDGDRYSGAAEVRQAWETVFAGSREAGFTTEEMLAIDDRVVVRWRYNWMDHDGHSGHVRGVDLFRIRDGLICEKLSYVKG